MREQAHVQAGMHAGRHGCGEASVQADDTCDIGVNSWKLTLSKKITLTIVLTVFWSKNNTQGSI